MDIDIAISSDENKNHSDPLSDGAEQPYDGKAQKHRLV